jgi:hypothetical protein
MLHLMDGARFPPDVMLGIQAKEFNLGFIRTENLVPHGQSPLGAFSHIYRGTLELCHCDHWVLGQLPDQGPSPLISQFGRATRSRTSLGGFKLLPFKNGRGHCVFVDCQCCRNVLVPLSPDLCPDKIMSQSSKDNSFDLMAWFLLWYTLSTGGAYIDRCVPFQIMSNHLNLSQVKSNQVVETSQGWSMETGWTRAQFPVS